MNRPAGASGGGGVHAGKAALVIVVLVIIGIVVLNHGPSHVATSGTTTHSTTPATSIIPSTTTTTVVPPASIKLQVLNGTGSGNLASKWATKLRTSPGYNTLAPDDSTSKVTQSEIFVETPGYLPEAYALAAAVGLGQAAVNTTIPAPANAPIPSTERSKANLVLIIGPDLANSV